MAEPAKGQGRKVGYCVIELGQREPDGLTLQHAVEHAAGMDFVRSLLGENDGSGANLVWRVDFSFGEGGGKLERDHLFVALYGEGSDVRLADGALEVL